jgi:antitoxin component of MazEF toxin-antitoxin module
MKIKKQIFRSGNSFVIYLDKSIMENLNLKEGDFVDVSDIYKINILPKNQTMKQIKQEIKKC